MMSAQHNTTLSAARALLDDASKAEDDLDDELDDLDIPAHIREARYAEIRRNAQLARDRMTNQHGEYTEVADTKEFLRLTTSIPRVVCHFYHPDMPRCAIIDRHLKQMAPQNFQTKFIRFNVLQSGFLVDKLKLQILPAVIAFIDGVVTPRGRIIGFEELGNTDNFTTMTLMQRLFETGVLTDPASAASGTRLQDVARVRAADPDADWD